MKISTLKSRETHIVTSAPRASHTDDASFIQMTDSAQNLQHCQRTKHGKFVIDLLEIISIGPENNKLCTCLLVSSVIIWIFRRICNNRNFKPRAARRPDSIHIIIIIHKVYSRSPREYPEHSNAEEVSAHNGGRMCAASPIAT